jgi:diguanylate cyclase (GGDEF)-like protein/PAS domain S-box-containing protein
LGSLNYAKNSEQGFEYDLVKKRNIKYFAAFLLLALACTFFIYLLYSKSEITLHNSYRDYTTVSQAASDIGKDTLLSQLSLADFIYTANKQSLDHIVSQNAHYDNESNRAFELLGKEFGGDKSRVNTIKEGYLEWLSVREKIIARLLLNEKRSLLLPLLEQNTHRVIAINKQLELLTKTTENETNNITQRPQNGSLKSLQIELLISVLLLSCLAVIFYTFQRRITKEKQAVSSALAWSNKLLDSSPDAMIISDRDGVISQVNKNAEDLFGYSKSEFVNLNIAKLMPQRFVNHHEKITLFFKRSSSREMGLGKTLYALNKQEKEFPVEISLNLAELNDRKVAITVIRDISEKKQNEALLMHQANYDLLTNLPNRRLINDRLNQAINRANRSNIKFGVLFIDLDHFKKANDLHGHEFGDKLLVCIANVLRALLRAEDTIGRLGGDEFLVIIPDIIHNESLTNIVEKILLAIERIEPIDGKSVIIGASIGISVYPDSGCNCDELIRSADLAMYYAKNTFSKKSYTHFEVAMLDKTSQNYALETALQQALENNEFYVVYQPKFEIKSLEIIGFEALLRWSNSQFSHLTPEDYIPILEKNNLINEVGDFVLKTSLEAIKHWQDLTEKELHVAVNVSPYQMKNPTFLSSIEKLLEMYQLDGRCLEIELTEQTLIEPSPMLEQALLNLRKIGVGIALDDFGTCYSSLHYLANYPITSIKIDKSFINGINDKNCNEIKRVLVNTIVSLGSSLNLMVTAEGIELEEQIKHLLNINCDHGQGFYFSKPLTFEDITSLFVKNS